MKKSNVKLEEAIEYVNTMYHNKMNNDEEFTDLELASVRLLRERTLNKYEIERLNNIINKALEINKDIQEHLDKEFWVGRLELQEQILEGDKE